MLISDSRFDLVWFRLSCDHGWIRSGSVNVRKQNNNNNNNRQLPSAQVSPECIRPRHCAPMPLTSESPSAQGRSRPQGSSSDDGCYLFRYILMDHFLHTHYILIRSVCVFSSHPFWTSSSLDVPAGVTQEEGHTGFLIHLPSAVRALIFVARRIQPFLSLVDREVEFCVLTN